jgi:hypothetical protein
MFTDHSTPTLHKGKHKWGEKHTFAPGTVSKVKVVGVGVKMTKETEGLTLEYTIEYNFFAHSQPNPVFLSLSMCSGVSRTLSISTGM